MLYVVRFSMMLFFVFFFICQRQFYSVTLYLCEFVVDLHFRNEKKREQKQSEACVHKQKHRKYVYFEYTHNRDYWVHYFIRNIDYFISLFFRSVMCVCVCLGVWHKLQVERIVYTDECKKMVCTLVRIRTERKRMKATNISCPNLKSYLPNARRCEYQRRGVSE